MCLPHRNKPTNQPTNRIKRQASGIRRLSLLVSFCSAFFTFFLSFLPFIRLLQAGSGKAVSEVGSGMLVEHSGRAPRLEMVSFKKLNKGTLALGVVFKVSGGAGGGFFFFVSIFALRQADSVLCYHRIVF